MTDEARERAARRSQRDHQRYEHDGNACDCDTAFAKYMAAVREARRNPNLAAWRKGQTYFNVLYRVRPDLADQIRSNYEIDPFYQDKNVPDFLEWLAGRLTEEQNPTNPTPKGTE